MPFVPPNLDNRKFEDIVTEIRRRIPTFTPEWTDLNDSDPGITLAQLFAFMSEQLLFQINQVPEKGLITFLKMVGGERHPASPAVADVTLSLKSTSSTTDLSFNISAGTGVLTAGPPPGQKTPIRFETQIPFMLVNGDLVDVVSIDCSRNVTSFAAVNAAGKESFLAFPTGRVGEEFYLVFDLNVPGAGWPAGAFRLRVNAAGSTDVGDPPNDVAQPDEGPRLIWSFGSGTDSSSGVDVLTFTDFTPSEDSTDELIRSGYLEFTFQDAAAAAAFKRASANDDIAQFQGKFVLRARLTRPDAFADVGLPSIATIRLNTVPARAVQTVSNEALGASNGQPSQQLQLARTPIIVGSTAVQVTPPGGIGGVETFHEIDDIFTAGPSDLVYELLPATGVLLFGDGVHGKIPSPDDGSIPGGNVKALVYQFGGGAVGNVGAKSLTTVIPSDASLPALQSTNVLPAAGGADEETTDHAIATAPAIVRSRFRAVSADDFEALAKATPNVRVERALALPNTQPGAAAGTTPGAVTVVLVPFAPFESSITTPIPLPSHIAAEVIRFLDQRRLVTTQVFVQAATFRKVTANVSLVVQPLAKINDTRAAVILALQTFFHALVGGSDGQGWPFGGTIFFSQVFQQVLAVPGVSRVEQLLLSLDDGTPVDCQDLPLRPGELLFSGSHTVLAQAESAG
jgi:predicted phage baseplate assembly protein